jgi:hypothetical protein
MTRRRELMSLSSKPFAPVPALPRSFQDAHFTAFLVRCSPAPPSRPSLWSRMGRLLSGIGVLLLGGAGGLRQFA